MGKDSPSPPPAPDYSGAALAQGAANSDTARTQARLGNPNIYGPYGYQEVSFNGDTPTIHQGLSPQGENILWQQNQTKLGLAQLGEQGVDTARSMMGSPFQYSGPGIQTSVGNPNLQTSFDNPNVTRNLDLSGVAKMPINAGTTAYQAMMARLDPALTQRRNMAETQLANQGLAAGGEAYDAAQRNIGQQENDARQQAAAAALGLDMSANAQGYGQALQSAQFGNQAAGQQYGQNLGAAQFANQASGQQFNQNLQGAQFGNTAAQQALAQQLQLRNQPLNEITALMSGSQIQNPQFQQYSGASVAPPPIFNAAQQQAGYNQGLYGLGVGQANSANSGMAGIGSAAISALPWLL